MASLWKRVSCKSVATMAVYMMAWQGRIREAIFGRMRKLPGRLGSNAHIQAI